ncbi:MAG: hypothetical protein JRN66_07010 [Nitrososphaerota archaeon]|nr:hypothetical protein [Nitrososphaerota archaeon]
MTDNHDGSTRYDIEIVFTVGGPGLGRVDLTAVDIVFLLSEADIKGYVGTQFKLALLRVYTLARDPARQNHENQVNRRDSP